MKKGLLIVLSGPSGVGKGTILKEFVNDPELNLAYSVSMTTRKMRPGEVEGVNYNFVDRSAFEQAIREGELLEYAEFVGNYYGTPLKNVEKLRAEGKNVLLEIEMSGCTDDFHYPAEHGRAGKADSRPGNRAGGDCAAALEQGEPGDGAGRSVQVHCLQRRSEAGSVDHFFNHKTTYGIEEPKDTVLLLF